MMQRLICLREEVQIYNALLKLSPYMFTPPSGKEWVKKYAQKLFLYAEMYVAQVSGEAVGMIAFYCNDFNSYKAYLTTLVVKDTYREKGVGAGLLAQMIKRCKEQKMNIIGLDVCKINAHAISLYKKYGFEVKNTHEAYVYMEKILG